MIMNVDGGFIVISQAYTHTYVHTYILARTHSSHINNW